MLAEPLRARFQIRKSSDNLRGIAEPPVFMQRISWRAEGLRGVAGLRWLYATGPSYATIAVAGVVHQDTDPELGEVPDLEVKLGEDLSEDQQCIQKDLIRRHLDVFTYMPRETNLLQHRVSLKGNTPKVNIKQEIQCTVVGRP